LKVSLVQMNTQDNKSANLKSAAALINKAVAEEQPDLVVLPEYYALARATV
jgi:predicted amidohydrolase